MPTDPKIIEIENKVDEKFYQLECGDGTQNGGGKSCWRKLKENISLEDIKSIYRQEIKLLLSQKEKEIKEEIKEWAIKKRTGGDEQMSFKIGFRQALKDLISFLEKGK